MTEYSEPQRLLDDPNVAEPLRSDLATVTGTPPLAYDATNGLSRFKAIVAVGGAGGLGAAAIKSSSVFGGSKALIAGLAGVVLAGGIAAALFVGVSAPAPTSTAPESAALEPAEPASGLAPAPEEPPEMDMPAVSPPAAVDAADEPSPPAVEPVPPVVMPETPAAAKPAPAAKKPAKANDADDGQASDYMREARKVQQAKKALKTEPAKALRLLEAVEREFPDGLLMEEREGLYVLALLATGKVDAGKRRADAYLAQYPKGTLAARVRRALAESP